MERVIRDFKLKDPKFEVIPNAVDTSLFDPEKTVVEEQYKKYEGCILCVARIEGRKCQADLVEAVRNSPYHLVLVGKPGKNALGYYEAVKNAAGSNVTFINHLEHDKLPQFYKLARVHALVSWMETPGLSSLEAGIMGANLVITPNGDTYDYFGDHAFYCKPGNIASVRNAIDMAYSAPRSSSLQSHIRTHFTWEKTALTTLAAYKQIIK